MARYAYDGPVMEFEKCIAHRWQGSTLATSEGRARSNLVYQFKQQNKKIPSSKITLPGKIVLVK